MANINQDSLFLQSSVSWIESNIDKEETISKKTKVKAKLSSIKKQVVDTRIKCSKLRLSGISNECLPQKSWQNPNFAQVGFPKNAGFQTVVAASARFD